LNVARGILELFVRLAIESDIKQHLKIRGFYLLLNPKLYEKMSPAIIDTDRLAISGASSPSLFLENKYFEKEEKITSLPELGHAPSSPAISGEFLHDKFPVLRNSHSNLEENNSISEDDSSVSDLASSHHHVKRDDSSKDYSSEDKGIV